MVRLKIAYWEFDFEAMCPTLDHDLLSQAHIYIISYAPLFTRPFPYLLKIGYTDISMLLHSTVDTSTPISAKGWLHRHIYIYYQLRLPVQVSISYMYRCWLVTGAGADENACGLSGLMAVTQLALFEFEPKSEVEEEAGWDLALQTNPILQSSSKYH